MPSCSSGERSTQLWKGIWHLQAPYKVKQLIWKAASETLPTLHNQLLRGMVKYACCLNCKSDGDNYLIVVGQGCLSSRDSHVIQDVLFIASSFLVCNSTHVKCLGNSVAHFLAKRAKLGNELQVWFESINVDIAPLF